MFYPKYHGWVSKRIPNLFYYDHFTNRNTKSSCEFKLMVKTIIMIVIVIIIVSLDLIHGGL